MSVKELLIGHLVRPALRAGETMIHLDDLLHGQEEQSTPSTPIASVSRPSTGPRHACARRSRPIAGRGSCCWPTPSSAWRGQLSRRCTCPGRLPNVPIAGCSPQAACVRHFRTCWSRSGRPQTRQNPAAAHQDARKVPAPAEHSASQRSEKPPDFLTRLSPSQNQPPSGGWVALYG